jgi:hypothetical protein
MQMRKTMRRLRFAGVLTAAISASACGVGELGASAAAGGASRAEEAKQAHDIQDEVRERLDAAAAESARRREEMEAQTQ